MSCIDTWRICSCWIQHACKHRSQQSPQNICYLDQAKCADYYGLSPPYTIWFIPFTNIIVCKIVHYMPLCWYQNTSLFEWHVITGLLWHKGALLADDKDWWCGGKDRGGGRLVLICGNGTPDSLSITIQLSSWNHVAVTLLRSMIKKTKQTLCMQTTMQKQSTRKFSHRASNNLEQSHIPV